MGKEEGLGKVGVRCLVADGARGVDWIWGIRGLKKVSLAGVGREAALACLKI